MNAQTAKIGHLTADTAIINRELVAQRANIHQLNADVADIGHLNAAVANIGEALIGKATVAEIEAATGYIHNLNADYARIKSLLAGNQVTGDLQAIHLTSQTAVIDQAVIDALVANYGIVHTLLATYLDTSAITIRNSTSDGGIEISGDTIKFIELDENDQPFTRIQIGRDSQDNFTFVLYDSTGEGVLIDQTGIKSSSIADGLIRDEKLAVKGNGYSGITADKLNIDSVSTNVVNDINSSAKTIKSANIYFDDQNKTLNQIYSEITTGMTDMAAAISGIDTLSSVNMVLTNDVHVVRANADGTNPNYTGCNTTAKIFTGSVDVTEDTNRVSNWGYSASTGINGTWDLTTKTYTVTGMTVQSGYVEISADYTHDASSDPITLTKRFNVIKLVDGDPGEIHFIRVDPKVIYRKSDGTWTSSITVLRYVAKNGVVQNIGTGTKIRIYYSTNTGSTWTLSTTISTSTAKVVYPPSSSLSAYVNRFKVELLDSNHYDDIIDTEIIHVASDVGEINTAFQTLSSNYASTVTGPDGLVSRVGGMETEITGISNSLDKTILYNITHKVSGNSTTCYAHVWKECREVTSEFNSNQFTWYKRDETGELYLGEGYSITVNNSDFEFSGVVVGRFTTYEEDRLMGSDSKALAFGNNIVSASVVEQ